MTIWLLFASCLILQDAAQDDSTQFSIMESFTVRAGALEAVVTDKSGKRISGLNREAFSILIDGEAVPITLFEEIKESTQNTINATITRDQRVVEKSSEANTEPKRIPNNYLVFMDDWFTKRPYRARLLNRLSQEIDRLEGEDQMAFVRFKGGQLELLQPYTNDRKVLTQTLKKLKSMPTAELARHTRVMANFNSERMMTRQVETVEGNVGSGSPEMKNATAEGIFNNLRNPRPFENDATFFQAILGMSNNLRDTSVHKAIGKYFDQVSKTANAVELAMRGLHQSKGRNTLLLLSEGWALNIKDALPQGSEAPGQEVEGMRFTNLKEFESPDELLRPITDTANMLGYTIYPLHVSQVDPGIFMATRVGLEKPMRVLGEEQKGRFSSLNFVAEQTGGEVITKAHRQELPFTHVIEDLQNYYRMSFSFPDSNSTARHKIEVKVLGDFKVRHRKEFRQRSETERKVLISQAAMLTQTQDRLEVTLGQARKHGRAQQAVPFQLQIPTDWMSAIKSQEGFAVQLELTISSQDNRGNESEMVSLPLFFEGTGTPPEIATYKSEIAVRKKNQRLVFVIHDLVGGGSIHQALEYSP